MKSVLVLLTSLMGAQAFACKMTRLGSDARAFDAIANYVAQKETHNDISLNAIYHTKTGYAYEVVSQGKCLAVPVKVEVGADCSHTVVKLTDKISCRLN